MRVLVLLLIVIFTLVLSTKAQEECSPETVKIVIPHYPAAAIALNAIGEVKVTVTVDNNGNVLSAVAGEGSKSLRNISETASKEWKFSILEKKYEKKCNDRKAILNFNYVLLPSENTENGDSWSFVSLPYSVIIKKIKPLISTYQSDSPNKP